MIKIYLVFLMLISSTLALADMHVLASVTNSMDNDKYTLNLETGENDNLVMLHVLSTSAPTDHYNLTQVRSGVTLVKRGERDIIRLTAKNLHELKGGVVTVSFLYNGITGKRKSEQLEIIPQDGKWIMQSIDRIIVKSIHFKTKKILGKIVGLRKMEINN